MDLEAPAAAAVENKVFVETNQNAVEEKEEVFREQKLPSESSMGTFVTADDDGNFSQCGAFHGGENCAEFSQGSRRIGPGLHGEGCHYPSADDSYPGELNCLNQTATDLANEAALSPQVLADYKRVISRLYMYGIPVFLISGSFLSQHRDCGQWNVNDHDLDLGIFADDLYRLPGCGTVDGVHSLIKYALHFRHRHVLNWEGIKCTSWGLPYQLYEKGKIRCNSSLEVCQSTIDIIVYHRTDLFSKAFAPDARGYVYHRNWGVKYPGTTSQTLSFS